MFKASRALLESLHGTTHSELRQACENVSAWKAASKRLEAAIKSAALFLNRTDAFDPLLQRFAHLSSYRFRNDVEESDVRALDRALRIRGDHPGWEIAPRDKELVDDPLRDVRLAAHKYDENASQFDSMDGESSSCFKAIGFSEGFNEAVKMIETTILLRLQDAELRTKKYSSYITMANNTSKRRQKRIEELQKQLADVIDNGVEDIEVEQENTEPKGW